MVSSLIDLLRGSQKQPDAEPQRVFMLVGLGNPGRLYRDTRHNIGFSVIDSFSLRHGIKLSKVQNKAIVGVGKFSENRIILIKPQTYMNLSGSAVASLVHYYKVPIENLIVVNDDVDLPFGVIRIRPGGGSAGQKGVKSIIERLGTQNFARLRMGIGRPPGQQDAAAYVLQRFPKSEEELLNPFIEKAVDALESFAQNGLQAVMNKYNTHPQD